eukprot:766762-Hanusia_phi.AAC.4
MGSIECKRREGGSGGAEEERTWRGEKISREEKNRNASKGIYERRSAQNVYMRKLGNVPKLGVRESWENGRGGGREVDGSIPQGGVEGMKRVRYQVTSAG